MEHLDQEKAIKYIKIIILKIFLNQSMEIVEYGLMDIILKITV